jgi:DNA-binding transcriptional MerR regulator
MAMNRRAVAPKEYYSIGEVCDLVGLKAHVLRYWETQFPPLRPSKNRAGNRVYRRKEIELVLFLKRLLHDEKYTIEGARRKLDQLRRDGHLREEAARSLDGEMLALLRRELDEIAAILEAGEPA